MTEFFKKVVFSELRDKWYLLYNVIAKQVKYIL